jgi:hypothetical protein
MITEKINHFGKQIEVLKKDLFVDVLKLSRSQSKIAKKEDNDCVVRAFMVALDISYDGGILHIVCSDDMAEVVEDLEYGTETSSPNAVLRPFTIRADQYVGDIVGGRAADYLFEQKLSL